MPTPPPPNRAKLGSTFGSIAQQLAALANWTQQQAPKIPTVAIPLTTSAWITPTLINSWANYGSGLETAAYLKDPFGFVHPKGFITGGTNGTVAFVLPAGYRPGETLDRSGATAGGVTAEIQISPSGNVTIFSSSTAGVGLGIAPFLAQN